MNENELNNQQNSNNQQPQPQPTPPNNLNTHPDPNNTPNNPTSTPPINSVPQPPKNKSKKPLIIAILVILLLVIAGLTYWFVSDRSDESQQTDETSEIESTMPTSSAEAFLEWIDEQAESQYSPYLTAIPSEELRGMAVNYFPSEYSNFVRYSASDVPADENILATRIEARDNEENPQIKKLISDVEDGLKSSDIDYQQKTVMFKQEHEFLVFNINSQLCNLEFAEDGSFADRIRTACVSQDLIDENLEKLTPYLDTLEAGEYDRDPITDCYLSDEVREGIDSRPGYEGVVVSGGCGGMGLGFFFYRETGEEWNLLTTNIDTPACSELTSPQEAYNSFMGIKCWDEDEGDMTNLN